MPQANFVPKIQYSQGNYQILCLRLAFFLTSIWLKQGIVGEASSFSSTRIMLQILPCQKQQLQKCSNLNTFWPKYHIFMFLLSVLSGLFGIFELKVFNLKLFLCSFQWCLIHANPALFDPDLTKLNKVKIFYT